MSQKMKVIEINAPSDGVLIMYLGDGSYAGINGAQILHLSDEQHDELCEGAELYSIEGDMPIIAKFKEV